MSIVHDLIAAALVPKCMEISGDGFDSYILERGSVAFFAPEACHLAS